MRISKRVYSKSLLLAVPGDPHAQNLQFEEMHGLLGPVKGKDFVKR